MHITTKVLSLQNILKYKKIYFETLGQLTDAPLLDDVTITNIYNKATSMGSYFIAAFDKTDELVGIVTLLVEQKFTRGGKLIGHVEELITRKGYEGRGIGSTLLNFAYTLAEEYGCYKIILDCENELVPFYEKYGYKLSGGFLRRYII